MMLFDHKSFFMAEFKKKNLVTQIAALTLLLFLVSADFDMEQFYFQDYGNASSYYKNFSLQICPCVSYFNIVNFTCLFEEIKENGPISLNCVELVLRVGSLHSKSPKFQLLDLGNPNCSSMNYDSFVMHYVDATNTWWPEIKQRSMTLEDCQQMEKVYGIISYEKQIYDFLALNSQAELEKQNKSGNLGLRINFYTTYMDGSFCSKSSRQVKYEFFVREHADLLDNNITMTSVHTYILGRGYGKPTDGMLVFARSSNTFCSLEESSLSLGTIMVGHTKLGLFSQPFEYEYQSINVRTRIYQLPSKEITWNFTVESVRLYENNSISFSLQWQCPYWENVAQRPSTVVTCGFYLQTGPNFGNEFNNCIGYSCPDTHNLLGPTVTVTALPGQISAAFTIQVGFENNTYRNGSMISIPTEEQDLLHIFKYNYYTGNFARYGTSSHVLYDDEHKDYKYFQSSDLYYKEMFKEYVYFNQSIILPAPFNHPQVLTSGEVSKLAATCHAKESTYSASGMPLSNTVDVFFNKSIRSLELYYGDVFNTAIHGVGNDNGLYMFKYNPANQNWHFEKETNYLIASSTPDGMYKILTDLSEFQTKRKDGGVTVHLKTYVPKCFPSMYNPGKKTGCYHLFFKKWYAFVEFQECTYFLGSYKTESKNVIWGQIPWEKLESRKGRPFEIKCPQLHSMIAWSEYDSTGKINVFKLNLNPLNGDPNGVPEKLSNAELCACSGDLVMTIPAFDMVYSDVDNANLLKVAVLCGDTVCSSDVNQNKLQSTAIKILQSPNGTSIYWFAVDQNNIFSLLTSLEDPIWRHGYMSPIFVDSQGENSQVLGSKDIVKLVDQEKHSAVGSTYHNRNTLKYLMSLHSAEKLPVPPKQCILPFIEKIEIKMISEVVAEILTETSYSKNSKCQIFAKPGIIFNIQYSALETNPNVNLNSSSFCCKDDNVINSEKKILNCHLVSSNYSVNSVTKISLGPLIPDRTYFIKLTANLYLNRKLTALWFAGAEKPSKSMLFNTKYFPPETYNSEIILGIVIPIFLIMAICVTAAVLYYRKKYYIYQYLTRLSAKDIHREEKLGEGNFGEVWKCKMGKETIVVKILKESATDKEEKEFREEALLLSKFHSESIIKAIGICLQSRPIMLALEYMDGGSLTAYLKKTHIRAILDVKDLLLICKEAIKGCIYLESEGYVHRDIAARNCLISMNENNKPKLVKISDFGLTKDIGKDMGYYRTPDPYANVLPMAWTAPEAFLGRFSNKSDVWAFGVLIWEVFSFGATPFGKCSFQQSHTCKLKYLTHNEIEYNVCIEKKTLFHFPDPCSALFCPALKKILAACWCYEPGMRPTFKQLQHFLNGAGSEILQTPLPHFAAWEDNSNSSVWTSSDSSIGLIPTSAGAGSESGFHSAPQDEPRLIMTPVYREKGILSDETQPELHSVLPPLAWKKQEKGMLSAGNMADNNFQSLVPAYGTATKWQCSTSAEDDLAACHNNANPSYCRSIKMDGIKQKLSSDSVISENSTSALLTDTALNTNYQHNMSRESFKQPSEVEVYRLKTMNES